MSPSSDDETQQKTEAQVQMEKILLKPKKPSPCPLSTISFMLSFLIFYI